MTIHKDHFLRIYLNRLRGISTDCSFIAYLSLKTTLLNNGFDGGVEAGIAGRSGDLREKLQLFIN